MKNQIGMYFRRNRYFNGKLLTAEDFNQEQVYMNDKRRLHNLYFHGMGVAAGLEVIRVDEYTVSVERGVALDGLGREIVVQEPAICRLSLLEGYEEAADMEGSGDLYLWIAYDEEAEETVHNIARSSGQGEELEHGKYREGYRLYVTDCGPKRPDPPGAAGAAEDLCSWVRGRGETAGRGSLCPGVCLAKIYLTKAGPFYMIDRIDNQSVCSLIACQEINESRITALINGMETMEKKLEDREENAAFQNKELIKNAAEADREWQFAQGQAVISLGSGSGKKGKRVYSGEIAHGLGPGNVQILLRVIRRDDSYSGAEGIFPEEEQGALAASCVNRSQGTFRIGLRLLADLEESEITVGWTAVRKRSANEFRELEKRVFVKPGMVNVKPRETLKLEAVLVNCREETVGWTVKTPEGGEIEPDGTYHAPNRPGVYEVTAFLERDPEVMGTVFAIVRE